MDKSYSKLVTMAAVASMVVAGVLIIIKLVAWVYTGSASILASLTDSLLDISASFINLVAIRYALTPPDDAHRFGHGKAESLAGLAQSAFISASALFLVITGVSRLIHQQEVSHAGIGVGITVIALILTVALVAFQTIIIRKTQSIALKADRLHYKTDVLLNLFVLVAIVLSWYGWHWADSVFAIMIGIYILYSALVIGYGAIQVLLDRRLPREEHDKIVHICRSMPGVLGIHDLRTRRAGPTRFMQLHIELDANLLLSDAHQIAFDTGEALRRQWPGSDVIIHMDPVAVE